MKNFVCITLCGTCSAEGSKAVIVKDAAMSIVNGLIYVSLIKEASPLKTEEEIKDFLYRQLKLQIEMGKLEMSAESVTAPSYCFEVFENEEEGGIEEANIILSPETYDVESFDEIQENETAY